MAWSWRVPDHPPTNPGCLVVPSYALKNAREPTRPTRAQLELAADWWRIFPQAAVIVSTGDNQRLGVTNASVMADYLAGLGVEKGRIIREDRSRNTFDNLENCLEIVQASGFGQPTLVTFDLYTRRAVAIARKMSWPDLRWVSATSAGEPAAGWKYFQTHSRTTILLYEIGATAYCRLKGWM
jgi:uncharacterized SAM-binding protein YcdF (DUF218 family)